MKMFFSFLIIATLLACNDASQTATKANFLLLYTDDQTYHSIQELGNHEIQTPHLDRLTAMGTTFTHAYNQGGWHGAVCVASRSMMVSGLSIWQAQEQADLWRAGDSLALADTWGQLMSRAGYRTYMTGKWHVAAPAPQVFGTARNIRPGMPGDYRKGLGQNIAAMKKALAEGGTVNDLMPLGYNRPLSRDDHSWLPTDSAHGGFWEGGKHWSEVVRDDALDYLDDASQHDDPFFMYVAFNAPHDPRQAPQEFIDMYPVDDIELPANYLDEHPYKEEIGSNRFLRDEALAPFPRTPYAVQKHRQEYYAIISHLDRQVGIILDRLEELGLKDNTYIAFTSDHGLSVGQHGLLGKQSLYDHSVRVPMILCGPDIPAGQRRSEQVYLQDAMATALDIAGVEQPQGLYFRSLLDLAKGVGPNSYPYIYGAYRMHQRMVRSESHKLLLFPKVAETRLFDMKEDPLEMNDLSSKPEHQGLCKELFAELLQLQSDLGDTLNLQAIYPDLL